MSCGNAGKKRSTYTGNPVGWMNYVGNYGFVAGGLAGLSAGALIEQFTSAPGNRSPWTRQDAKFDDKLLDAAYPTIDLQWLVDIEFDADTIFRVSDRSFYVIDAEGVGHFYDARADQAPQINVTVGEWLKENYEVGDVQIKLNNRDGYYNDWLPLGAKYRQWTGVKVTIKVGFGENIANYFTLFEGNVTDKQGLTATRDTVEIRCYDKFDLDQIPMPPRVFSSDNFPDIDTSYAGKPVPLVYGDWSESVPTYGAVNAICTNANEPDPVTYKFKISDLDLLSIDEVYLHRGERSADKPQGPIKIADNILIRNEASGEFEVPSDGVVLDEPYYIGGKKLKAGPGTSGSVIRADEGFNYIEQGVKIGDRVVSGTETQAKIIAGNIEYKATNKGAGGNGVSIEYYLLDWTYVETYNADLDRYETKPGKSHNKCYATLVGSTVRVGITRYHDKTGALQTGTHTAGAIQAAVRADPSCNAIVRTALVGVVPFGYPPNSRVSDVLQTVPMSPVSTSGGQNAAMEGEITSVSNFSITVTSAYSFVGPDSGGQGRERVQHFDRAVQILEVRQVHG
jgi:hypothetical protein